MDTDEHRLRPSNERDSSERHRDSVALACAAWIAKESGGSVAGSSFPDQAERHQPAVDLEFWIGNARFVLEHTELEPFGDHTAMEKSDAEDFSAWAKEIEPSLTHGALCVLRVPAKRNGLFQKSNAEEQIKLALKSWVLERVPALHARSDGPTRPADDHREADSVIPFPVTLSVEAWPPESKFDQWFRVSAIKELETEEPFENRVGRALDKKLPKLHRSKGGNATSVMLLEVRQHAMETGSNRLVPSFDLAETFVPKLCKSRDDVPDIVMVVDTQDDKNGYWLYRLLKWGNQWGREIKEKKQLGPWWHDSAKQDAAAAQKQAMLK